MGAGQSALTDSAPSTALHVLRVSPNSPASKTSIEPLFDFVAGFEDDSLTSTIDVAALERIVANHENNTLNLLVWNAKSRETRVVPVVPSRAWAPPNVDPAQQPSLLGLSLRMCAPEVALDTVWHVLDVLEGSPAESAGLVPYGDYITGWTGGVLSSENDFYELVEAHIDKPLRVYVYSHDFDALREVVLVPNRHWGGDGLLGCVFGYGLLHRIPPQPAERIAGALTPPELHEPADDEYEEQALFVPADVQYQVPSELVDWRRQQEEEWHEEQQRMYHPTPVATIQEDLEESTTPPNEHDHSHPHGHSHGHDAHDHHHHSSEPSPTPPRRTASLNASALRASGSPTPVFSAPSRLSGGLSRSPAPQGEVEGSDDRSSVTSVD
ncbi:Golgi reassembly stacking protein 2 [Mycena kentingensis (nom. inval.)]|nr:Golgi reassembly stacking protein 2 [Mycena kentingensis (nom. inval.)]